MANIIDRSALSGLIPEPVTREIMQGTIAESALHGPQAGEYVQQDTDHQRS